MPSPKERTKFSFESLACKRYVKIPKTSAKPTGSLRLRNIATYIWEKPFRRGEKQTFVLYVYFYQGIFEAFAAFQLEQDSPNTIWLQLRMEYIEDVERLAWTMWNKLEKMAKEQKEEEKDV